MGIMECKRCGGKDHPNANCFACPENLIRKKIESWDGACLAECVITDAVIAGFFDADGCINFDNEGHFRVQLCQSHQFGLDVLHLIQLWFGSGSLTGPARNAEYKLRWCGNAGTTVLECCLLYGVIKGSNHLRFYNMSDEWLGGLFAGDGCVRRMPNGTPSVSIAQGNHPLLLYAIQKYLGFGSLDKGERIWFCYGQNARTFARRFAGYSLHKRADLLAILS